MSQYEDVDAALAELEQAEVEAQEEEAVVAGNGAQGDAAECEAEGDANAEVKGVAEAMETMEPVLESLSEGMEEDAPQDDAEVEAAVKTEAAGEDEAPTEPKLAAKSALAAKPKPGLLVRKAAPASGGSSDSAAKPSAAKLAAAKAAKPGLLKKPAALLAKPANKRADKENGQPVSKQAAKPAAVITKKPAVAPPEPKPNKPDTAEPDAKPPAGKKGKKEGPKRPLSAYMWFANENRERIKAEQPELTFGELGKELGAMWKAMADEDKAPYEVKAAEDKERYECEKAGCGGAGGGAGDAASRRAKGPRGPTAFSLFCEDRRAGVRADNPKAGAAEVNKLLSTAWTGTDDETKEAYQAKAKEARGTAAKQGGAEGPKPERAVGRQRKRKAADVEEEDEEGIQRGDEGAGEEPGDDEAERMAVDWEAHPPQAILSTTRDGKYVVLRRGLGLHDYGLVDGRAAKMQRLGQESACPLSLEMIDEYEAHTRAFKRAVHDSMDGSSLDLEDLPAGSKLEACSFLGSMREPGYELGPGHKKDFYSKWPTLATSQLMQRLLDIERSRVVAAEARAAAAEARAAAAEAALAAAGVPAPAAAEPKPKAAAKASAAKTKAAAAALPAGGQPIEA